MNWIANAISKPGALHAQLGVPQNKTIPQNKVNAAASGSYGKKAQKRADLAKTLGGLRGQIKKKKLV